jgi:hypothetical protein
MCSKAASHFEVDRLDHLSISFVKSKLFLERSKMRNYQRNLENQQIAALDFVSPTFIRKKERLAITKLLNVHLVSSNSVSTRS